MVNPADLKYTKEHEWVRVEGDVIVMGVTDFAQKRLTDIVFVELPEAGKKVQQNKPCAVIESVKSVSDIFSPISGEIIEVNERLKDNPEIINNDPYKEGWIAKIRIENKNELNSLISVKDYEKFINEHKH